MIKDEVLMKELIKEANDNGFEIQDFNDLNSMKRKIKKIIPILIKYLYLFDEGNFKDAIIGLLGVKGFYDATETLIKLYYNYDIIIDKWAIGDALYNIQDKRFEDEYIKIIEDKDNGISRQMIVMLLGKLKCQKALPTLVNLLQDTEVNGHAIIALSYFNDNDLIQYIEPFINHDKKWIRTEAEKAIKKIRS